MKIRIESRSVNDDAVEVTETTLEQFLADDDGIGDEEATKIRHELETTGHSRIAGFVGSYADIYPISA
jgi:hypothetical protein